MTYFKNSKSTEKIDRKEERGKHANNGIDIKDGKTDIYKKNYI